jgi:molybdenum cofactor guanylyltransferase
MIAGVVLAGGLSRRMGGGDKCLLPLGGRPLLARVIERFAPQVGPLFAAFGLPVIADDLPDHPGPLAGILAAMDWAHGLGADLVATVPGDTPFMPLDLVARLQDARAGRDLALARSDGRDHPVVGLFATRLRVALRGHLDAGGAKVLDWAMGADPGFADFDGGALPFFNVNTPHDLAVAELRAEAP